MHGLRWLMSGKSSPALHLLSPIDQTNISSSSRLPSQKQTQDRMKAKWVQEAHMHSEEDNVRVAKMVLEGQRQDLERGQGQGQEYGQGRGDGKKDCLMM